MRQFIALLASSLLWTAIILVACYFLDIDLGWRGIALLAVATLDWELAGAVEKAIRR